LVKIKKFRFNKKMISFFFVIRVSDDNEQFRDQPIDVTSSNIDKAVRKIRFIIQGQKNS